MSTWYCDTCSKARMGEGSDRCPDCCGYRPSTELLEMAGKVKTFLDGPLGSVMRETHPSAAKVGDFVDQCAEISKEQDQ